MDLLSFWLFSLPVKFDMGGYISEEDSKQHVTLRISKTRLFVSAQGKGQPVLLKVSHPQSPVYPHLHPVCLWMSPIDRPLAGWQSPPLFLPQFPPVHPPLHATAHLSPEALLGRI